MQNTVKEWDEKLQKHVTRELSEKENAHRKPRVLGKEVVKDWCKKQIMQLFSAKNIDDLWAKEINAIRKNSKEDKDLFKRVDELRECSNKIEELERIPEDYRDLKYWTKDYWK